MTLPLTSPKLEKLQSQIQEREEWMRLWSAAQPPALNILSEVFDKQRAFILDDSRRKVAVTGRRAGKTYGDGVHLLYTASLTPNCYVGYGAETRIAAKDLLWRPLTLLARKYFPGARTNDTELHIELPNRSMIKLFGAKDESEADKARGYPFRLVILDEVEAVRSPVLKYLLEDVLTASLADYQGALVCTGTPDASCMGYLYDIDQGEKKGPWSHYHWTMAENERFPRWSGRPDWREIAASFIQEELDELAIDINDPFVQREYFGRWVRSADAFILQIDEAINVYSPPAPPDLEHVLGIDLGFRDESAFVVNGFSRARGEVYQIAETGNPGLPIGQIIEIAKGLIEKYQPIRTVVDPATGGAALVEELRRRYGVSIQYAEKENKAAYFRLWNADIRAGRYKFLKGSKALAQGKAGQWNEKYTREMEGIPFDYFDSCLYSWRECYAWLPPRSMPILRPRHSEDSDVDMPDEPGRRSQRIRTRR